jgi:DNA-binding cell septation regulator SpoVG
MTYPHDTPEAQERQEPAPYPDVPPPAYVECIRIRPIQGHGAWVASATVLYGEATIHDIKLFEKSNRYWINGPSREYTTKEGEKKYAPIIEFDRDLDLRIRAAVRDAYLSLWEGTEPEPHPTPTAAAAPPSTQATDDDGALPF